MQRKNGKSTRDLSLFLLTRGAWLVLLELSVVRFGWAFTFATGTGFVQVIWAIGVSMMLLSALVYLPVRVVGAIGIAMIALHDFADSFTLDGFGFEAGLLHVVHDPGPVKFPWGYDVFVGYPLVPWVGVMAAGYAFGLLLEGSAADRRRRLLSLGGALIVAFVVVRALGVYGNPRPWHLEPTFTRSVISFLSCSKYPPSLCYLLMTLGPAIASLPLLEQATWAWTKPFLVFGRVPLFYYLLHLYLAHGVAVALSEARYGVALPGLFEAPFDAEFPTGYGYSLPLVYVIWLLVVAALYAPCAWFAGVKRRRRDLTWLSYL